MAINVHILPLILSHCGLQQEERQPGKCLLGLTTPIPACFHRQVQPNSAHFGLLATCLRDSAAIPAVEQDS